MGGRRRAGPGQRCGASCHATATREGFGWNPACRRQSRRCWTCWCGGLSLVGDCDQLQRRLLGWRQQDCHDYVAAQCWVHRRRVLVGGWGERGRHCLKAPPERRGAGVWHGLLRRSGGVCGRCDHEQSGHHGQHVAGDGVWGVRQRGQVEGLGPGKPGGGLLEPTGGLLYEGESEGA